MTLPTRRSKAKLKRASVDEQPVMKISTYPVENGHISYDDMSDSDVNNALIEFEGSLTTFWSPSTSRSFTPVSGTTVLFLRTYCSLMSDTRV